MKVTFIEEIESHKAWTNKMCCAQCDDFHYRIHHQLEPATIAPWWIECENCGHESTPFPVREGAILRWKNEC